MYGYQPSTPADRLLPSVGATTDATDKLTLIADIRNDANQLLKISKERMAAMSTRSAPIFLTGRSCLSFKWQDCTPFPGK
jgi:hypothetical protein